MNNPHRPFQIVFFFVLMFGAAVMYALGHYWLCAFDLSVALLNYHMATRA